jgi:AmmeMemoRadiSam system protein A
VEVQVPFLQVALGDFKLLPIVVWDRSEGSCAAIAKALSKVLAEKNVLLVASSDMSHYPKYDDANTVDKAMLAAIASFDVRQVFAADVALMGRGVRSLECTLCGFAPVVIVMDAAQRLGATTAEVLTYANSGDADPTMLNRCVGYCAVALCAGQATETRRRTDAAEPTGAEDLTAAQRREVLAVARHALEAYLADEEPPSAKTDDPALKRPSALFVTLKKQGMLRGCVGCFAPDAPLVEQAQKMAIEAATRDPRFHPLKAAELKDIEISIQVLSPIRPVGSPEEIRVGEHGVVVRQGARQGVYLPDVATEMGWTREQMLTSLCFDKARLPRDAWRRGAELYVFTTERFSEADFARQ